MQRIAAFILFALILVNGLAINVSATSASDENLLIELGTTVTGEFTDDKNNSVCFEVSKPGKATFNLSTASDVTDGNIWFSLVDVAVMTTSWSSLNGKYDYPFTCYLEKGTYIYTFGCSGNGTYTLTTELEQVETSFADSKDDEDNTVDAANVINLMQDYHGLIMAGDTDVYKFSLAESITVEIPFSCYATNGWIFYTIYDETLKEVSKTDLGYYDKQYGEAGEFNNKYELEPGDYYLSITSAEDSFSTPYCFSVREFDPTVSSDLSSDSTSEMPVESDPDLFKFVAAGIIVVTVVASICLCFVIKKKFNR